MRRDSRYDVGRGRRGGAFTVARVPGPGLPQCLCSEAQTPPVGRRGRGRGWHCIPFLDRAFVNGVVGPPARHAGLTGSRGGEGRLGRRAGEPQRRDRGPSTLLSLRLGSGRRDGAGERVWHGTGVGGGSAEEARHVLSAGKGAAASRGGRRRGRGSGRVVVRHLEQIPEPWPSRFGQSFRVNERPVEPMMVMSWV